MLERSESALEIVDKVGVVSRVFWPEIGGVSRN